MLFVQPVVLRALRSRGLHPMNDNSEVVKNRALRLVLNHALNQVSGFASTLNKPLEKIWPINMVSSNLYFVLRKRLFM